MKFKPIFLLVVLFWSMNIVSQTEVTYDLQMEGAAGTGTYMPYYLVSKRHGVVSVENNSGYMMAGTKISHQIGDWTFTGRAKLQGAANAYSNVYLQECFGQVSWKCFDLFVGTKEMHSPLRDFELSSGSLTWSGNCRPIPQIMFGNNRYEPIPGTKGWMEFYVEGGYGRVIDDNYMTETYNQYVTDNAPYTQNISVGSWYHHKLLSLRTNPNKPFVWEGIMDHCAMFGDRHNFYRYKQLQEGTVPEWQHYDPTAKDFWNILIPGHGGENSSASDQAHFLGNHLGIITFLFEYQWGKDLKHKIGAYAEAIYEDGSGMRKGNGYDGLWGLEYHNKHKDSWVNGVVFEYLQTTHQSGPILWNPAYNGLQIEGSADFMPNAVGGIDDYYNNITHNGYSHYGMACGSPMLKSPIYNEDHFQGFTDNRVKAWHIGVNGIIHQWQGRHPSQLDYRLLASYRQSWGNYYCPSPDILTSTNGLMEFTWRRGPLSASLSLAFDRGELYGKNNAANLRVCLDGILFKKSKPSQ